MRLVGREQRGISQSAKGQSASYGGSRKAGWTPHNETEEAWGSTEMNGNELVYIKKLTLN